MTNLATTYQIADLVNGVLPEVYATLEAAEAALAEAIAEGNAINAENGSNKDAEDFYSIMSNSPCIMMNESGYDHLSAELERLHKKPVESLMLSAFAADAERDNCMVIELESFNARSGHTELIWFDEGHFDVEYMQDEV